MYADLVENGGQRSVKERLNGNGTSGPTWLQQQRQITGKRNEVPNEFLNDIGYDKQGRFLLAAVSGRILAQSYHSILQVGYEMIEQAVNTTDGNSSEYQPEIAWKRWELSVMLEHVQAHVAPTDVDPGAGVQWLPKILRGSPKVMRTCALLERVFMPCDMYFQFTRHKGGTPKLKVILFVSL
ncbi:unnamed protein product [Sphenostylis stenocarpa]|uniref:Uncharacterized protein n=1 Tax=Sphenostylis stenocarpa TaxID=92480 RepID=A0AA86S1R3_9FABA|nr:unnamed protein product [Sphenostylis stenocarpa]